MSFYVQIRSFRPKIDPYVNLSNFQAEEIFHFQNFWDVSMRKEQQEPHQLTNFAKIWPEHVLKIKQKVAMFGHRRVMAALNMVIRALGLIGLKDDLILGKQIWGAATDKSRFRILVYV